MYTAPLLTELLLKQQQQRNQPDLFRQGKFTIRWRAKVGSFPHPDGETIISAGEPCGAWHPEAECPAKLSRPESKRNVGDNWNYFSELPLYGYIPASSIRGLVRSWVLKQKKPELRQTMEELLGVQQPEQDTITAGKIEFFDAWPVEPTKLSLDIVNPQEPFQVFHQGQSTPLSLYTLGDGDTSIPVNVAIRGIHPSAEEADVDTVWSWLEKALTLYGVGSRTASGYGSLKPDKKVKLKQPSGYASKTFNFTLYNQGCAGPNINTMELRPSHWRGWLRSWALRFFLGVMPEEDAQKTVSELFGTIEPEAIAGCVRIKMIQEKPWGKKSQDRPDFYTWKGQIKISAPQDVLNKIILPITQFAASVGGVGRGWRRPLHIFMMKTRNNSRKASRGTHLKLTTKSQKTGKMLVWGINPRNPELWQQTYQRWQNAVSTVLEEKWKHRVIPNANRNLEAEVFAPHTCAIYIVPYPIEEPINMEDFNWEFTDPLDTRGAGMDLIYNPDYKRQIEVGGSAAGGGNSHCSWVSIKRVKVTHPDKNIDTDCQEIVCLFLGETNPNSQSLRAKFLRDLHNTELNNIKVATHLFGVRPK